MRLRLAARLLNAWAAVADKNGEKGVTVLHMAVGTGNHVGVQWLLGRADGRVDNRVGGAFSRCCCPALLGAGRPALVAAGRPAIRLSASIASSQAASNVALSQQFHGQRSIQARWSFVSVVRKAARS